MRYVFVVAVVVVVATTILGQSYILRKGTFSVVGGTASSTGYILYMAGGQPSTGESYSTSYIEQAGFYTYGTVVISCQQVSTSYSCMRVGSSEYTS